MEYMNFRGALSGVGYFLERSPLSATFSAIVIFVLFGILLLLCRKAVIAGGILGFVSVAFAYINYMKVSLNGDNFFPLDVLMIGDAGSLISFMSGNVPPVFWVSVLVLVLWVIALWFFRVEVPFSWKIRLPSAICIILAGALLFSGDDRTDRVLGRFSMDPLDTMLQSFNYHTHGFSGAFILNLLNMRVERPEGYAQETIQELLEGFEVTLATEEYFDVIVVLSESFFDVRTLPGVEFYPNPLPNFDRIRYSPGTVSGLVYTTAFGGGTIRPEFEILTGLSTDPLPGGLVPYAIFRREMPSHVSHYRDMGYRTLALHPYNERFYSRHVGYPFLGFDDFLDYSELTERFDLDYVGEFISDISLMEPITYFLDGADDPTFMFVITMQNHHPFPSWAEEEMSIRVTSDRLDPDALEAVTSFTQGLHDADAMLGMLADYIDGRDRPTVLLFFGDHLPVLGPSGSAFVQSGLLDPYMCEKEYRKNQYTTPFLIYANRPLARGIFSEYMDNHISTYYLLSALAVMTEFHRTPYMNLLLDYHARVPVHNVRLAQPLTDEIQSLQRMLWLITYDRLVGNLYSVCDP